MIESAPGPIDIAYVQKMQGDDRNRNAEALVPVLLHRRRREAHLARIDSFLVRGPSRLTLAEAA